MASIESDLEDEKSNHDSFMKECHVGIIVEENKMSMVGTKLTSNNATEEYNVYRAYQEIEISSITVLIEIFKYFPPN